MSSWADDGVIRREAAIPGMGLLLDPEALGAAVRDGLGFRPDRIVPTYLRYKPGRNCLVGFDLRVGAVTTTAFGVAYGNLASTRRAKIESRQVDPGALGTGRFHIRHLGTTISMFPNDSRVRALRHIADADRAHQMVAKLVDADARRGRYSLKTLSYKPERRFAGMARDELGPVASVKLYGKDRFDRVATRPLPNPRDELRVPDRIGVSERRRAIAHRWARGALLRDLIANRAARASAVRRTGAALAELHTQTPPTALVRVPDPLERCRAAAHTVGRLLPSLAGRAERLADAIASGWNTSGDAWIHGDFYSKQVIQAADGTWLIDFDDAGRGDPAQDIGNFFAHAFTELGDPESCAEVERHLLEGYRTISSPPDPERIGFATASALLCLSHHPFRARVFDWPELTEEIVRAGERRLDGSAPARCVVPVLDPFGIAHDDSFEFAEECLDPTAMSDRLEDVAPGPVSKVRVSRHKTGRRFLAEYTTGSSTWIAKVHWRRADCRTATSIQALRECGFQSGGGRAFSVPRVEAIHDDLHMVVYAKAAGMPLGDWMLRGSPDRAKLGLVAKGLAELQGCAAVPPRTHGIDDELRILREQLGRLETLGVVPATDIARLESGAERELARLGTRPNTPAHRDLHPDQILLDEKRFTWLDWDGFCWADPVLDAGNFHAHLLELGTRTGREAAMERHAAVFVASYLAEAPCHRLDLQRWTAIALARLVAISQQIPARRASTGRSMRRALDLFAACEQGRLAI